MNLSDLTIGITSFLRPGYLRTVVEGAKKNFSDAKLLVCDDSDIPVPCDIRLDFDSGLCAKRNALVKATTTKYFLLGTDDLKYNELARSGVETMVETLEKWPEYSIAAGHVNWKPYEGYLEYVPGDYLKEIRYFPSCLCCDPRTANEVHIAVNYFVGRTKDLVAWDESLKIGGEHALWFLRMKQAGRRTTITTANINTQEPNLFMEDPRYRKFRNRCFDGHKRMKQILDIKRYIDFDGKES